MPVSRLREYLDGTRKRLLWLEYDAYARQVFANAATDWWSQSTRFATTMIQARKAIRTEVVTLDIAAPGFALSAPGAEALSSCTQALQDPAGQRFVIDSLDAIAHQLGAQVDLVLRVPVPLDLLRRAGVEVAPGFDDLDELTSAILALVRQCAEKPIAGLLLTRSADTPLTMDEQEAYAPLIHAAKHYGWVTCLQCAEPVVNVVAEWNDVDLYLCADIAPTQVAALNAVSRKFGGGLPPTAWLPTSARANETVETLWFGVIPADAQPEAVLTLCGAFGSSS